MATQQANYNTSNRRPSQNPLEYGRGGGNAGCTGMSGAASGDDQAFTPEVVSASEAEAMERVQLDIQIATAKRWPRPKPKEIVEQMLAYATMDEETAVSCFYSLEVDENGEKKKMTGPSIRLAEIAVTCFKNVRAGARVIGNNGIMLQSQGFCFDLENNVAVTITADRQIASSKWENGRQVYKTWSLDMQRKTSNAANSISYRNSVFKVIPAILIRPVLERCKQIAAGEGPIDERFQKAARLFKAWGITEAQLKTWLNKPGTPAAELTDEDIIDLRGLFTGLRDGEQTVQEVFGSIDKDGNRKEAAPGDTSATGAASGTGTRSAEPPQRGAPDDTKGPLTEQHFTEAEFGDLLTTFVAAGLGKNRAHLGAWLGHWTGTKREAMEEIIKAADKAKAK